MDKDDIFFVSQPELILAFSKALDLISPQLNNHQKNTAYIGYRIACELGLDQKEQKNILLSGLLHDIGAIYLNNDEKLELLKFDDDKNQDKHEDFGYFAIKNFPPFAELADIIKNHHARWDRNKNRIAITSYCICLADRIDVLINNKSFILNQRDTIKEKIRNNKSLKFHPECVEAFFSLSELHSFWLDITDDSIDEKLLSYMSNFYFDDLDLDNLIKFSELFGKIIDFRCAYTAAHTADVACIAKAIAEILYYPLSQRKYLYIAGLLHDIGKLVIPLEVLQKPSSLEKNEREIIDAHPYYTFKVLSKVKNMEAISKWTSFHHEKLNGTGYPFHLSSDKLSEQSRILAVSDIFSALREERPYKPSFSKQKLVGILNQMAKKNELDKDIVKIAIENYDYIEAKRISEYKKRWNEYLEEKFLIEDSCI